MAKADVLTLVNTLSTGLRDATAVDDYYDRIVFEHGLRRTSLTNAAYVAGVADTLTYALPAEAIRLIGVFYDSRWLYRENDEGTQLYDAYWRTSRGFPVAFTPNTEDVDNIDLVPRPTIAGETVGVATPFTTFPRHNLTVVYTANLTDVQPWEELATAAEILAREFGRESDHQDQTAAKAWREFAQTLFEVIDNAQGTPKPY